MSLVLQPQTEERLRSDEMAWLSTVRPDGRPHSVPVWFFWEGETILIFSKPNAQKVRNLRQNQAITLALDEAKRGVVILEGTALLLEPGDGDVVLEAYAEKYREGLKRIGVPAKDFVRFYSLPIRITPIRFISGS